MIRKKFSQETAELDKTWILTATNNEPCKAIEQRWRMERGVDEEAIAKYVHHLQETSEKPPVFSDACNAFEASLQALDQHTSIEMKCVSDYSNRGWCVNSHCHGFCANIPLLSSPQKRYIDESGTMPLIKPVDVIVKLAHRERRRGKTLKRLQFHAEPGAMPLLYYNINEECDPIQWKDEEERTNAHAYVKAKRAKCSDNIVTAHTV